MRKKDIQIENISGVDCYEKDGTVYLKLETVARGLGFTRIAKSGNEVVMWSRVEGYLENLGVHTSAHDDFIPENIFYRLAMKAKNETAEKFQAKVADEIIPTIRKTGGYVNDDEVFINTYLPFADDATRLLFKSTLSTVRKLNDVIEKQKKDIVHKQNVITGFTDDITLAEKRQILNRVVRYKNANYRDRWGVLYREFENKFHINLQYRYDAYNKRHKPKCTSKLDYVDKVMGKVPELYEIAAKLYENDVNALVKEMYGVVGSNG